MPESTDQASNENEQPEFNFARIYVKDVSFEIPHSPSIFNEPWEPDIKIQLDIVTNSLENNFHEVVLDITATATQGDRTAFLCEVKQAGIFLMKNIESTQQNQMLNVFCPDALFPYARETISALISKGGFPQLLITPVDFNNLYQQKLAQSQAPSVDAASEQSS